MDDKDFMLKKRVQRFNELKYWVTTVIIGSIILIVNWTFQFKDIKMAELEKENGYLNHFLEYIIDKDLGKRRDIAQYFAYVSFNDEYRDHWLNYYTVIQNRIDKKILLEKELRATVNRLNTNYSIVSDSISSNLSVNQNLKDTIYFKKKEIALLEGHGASSIMQEHYENIALTFIIDENLDSSILYLNKLLILAPYYHCAYEINNLLNSSKSKLSENKDYWGTIKKIIYSDYSWGLNKDLKELLIH